MFKPDFLPNLVSPLNWYLQHNVSKAISQEELCSYMFKRPLTQINFLGDYSYEDIQNLVYSIASQRGEVLEYNSKPFLRLPDYTNQPVERHYDGISSITKDRVPDWVFFLHSANNSLNDSIISNTNGFTISNGHLAYKKLTDESKKLLSTTSEVILNHKVGTSNTNANKISDLLINMRQDFNNIPIFRGHIPFLHTCQIQHHEKTFYCYPDNLTINFGDLDWTSQVNLMNDSISTLDSQDVSITHFFSCHSLLVVHNKSCFHSCKALEAGEKRVVHRLQLIDH